jgi:hypothetical protein
MLTLSYTLWFQIASMQLSDLANRKQGEGTMYRRHDLKRFRAIQIKLLGVRHPLITTCLFRFDQPFVS